MLQNLEQPKPELLFDLWGSTDQIDEADLEDVRSYAAYVAECKKASPKEDLP